MRKTEAMAEAASKKQEASPDVTSNRTGSSHVNLGIQAMHANGFSLGARYGLNAGSAGKQDHAFKLEIRKMF